MAIRVQWAEINGWLKRWDFVLLCLATIVLGTIWGFVELADEVMEGSTDRIDRFVLRSLRRPDDVTDPVGPLWMEEMGRDLTALGGTAVLTLIVVAVVGYLTLSRKYRAIWLVLGASLGSLLVSQLLKGYFDRPRPDFVPHLSHVYSASFPSGHSMLSAAIYLTMGALLARLVEDVRLKLYFIGVAMVLSLLVGVSRVYLGVHYPTDVLAGWTAGLAWAVLCWMAARLLQKRGVVDAPEEEDGPHPATATGPQCRR